MANNSHIDHVEDSILIDGADGARRAISILRATSEMLAGNAPDSLNLTVKWDGSPSIFAGTDPRDGKFFVATKSIFNKEPKIFKTTADIDAELSGDLARKMKVALAFLPELDIDGIVQGDFLFSRNDLATETIQNKQYVTFHPNTIVYAVPTESTPAEMIRRAKIGIALHTKYEGDDFENLTASSFNPIGLTKTPNVWCTSSTYRDVSGNATLTKREMSEIAALLSTASRLLHNIPQRHFDNIGTYYPYLSRFINSRFVSGEGIPNPIEFATNFVTYLSDMSAKEAGKRFTARGKNAVLTKFQSIRDSIDVDQLARIIRLYNITMGVKNRLIIKLNKADQLNTFLRTDSGYQVTGPEGFVVTDRFDDKTVKLVDRLEFSHANFSPDVAKGWQR